MQRILSPAPGLCNSTQEQLITPQQLMQSQHSTAHRNHITQVRITSKYSNDFKYTHTIPYNSVRPFKVTEIRTAINKLRSIKSHGYDLITDNVLNNYQQVGMRAITQIFNSILRTGHFPGLWKVSQIIPIIKPEKTSEEAQSYKPIAYTPYSQKYLRNSS
jgi:hypothetical protein